MQQSFRLRSVLRRVALAAAALGCGLHAPVAQEAAPRDPGQKSVHNARTATRPVIDGVLEELKPIQERAARYAEDPMLVKNIVAEGCERARKLARETMRDVREAMGLNYS